MNLPKKLVEYFHIFYSSDKSKDDSNVTVDTISAPDLMYYQKMSSELYFHATFLQRVASPWVKSKLVKENHSPD